MLNGVERRNEPGGVAARLVVVDAPALSRVLRCRRVNARTLVLPFSALLVLSCTEHDPELGRVGGPIPVYEAGSAYSCSLDGGIDPTCSLPPADTPGAQIPCSVAAVLGPLDGDVQGRRCHRCHVEPQENGAPFPLLTWANTQGIYGNKPIWTKMYAAVCEDFMPYCGDGSCPVGVAPVPAVLPLTPSQKSTLLEWLSCPQPVFDVVCE
jgi:hypothetical protein